MVFTLTQIVSLEPCKHTTLVLTMQKYAPPKKWYLWLVELNLLKIPVTMFHWNWFLYDGYFSNCPMTILEKFQIIICHKSNSILKLFCLFVCILLFVLHYFNVFAYLYFVVCFTTFQCSFFGSISILLWTSLMNWTSVGSLLNKSRV
jgi:hypothetical protein